MQQLHIEIKPYFKSDINDVNKDILYISLTETNQQLPFFDWSHIVLQVAQLMMIDCKRAVPLFIQHRDIISPSDVVSQLIAAKNKCDYCYFLHLYLHSLFESNPHAGRDFHDMQVCRTQCIIYTPSGPNIYAD